MNSSTRIDDLVQCMTLEEKLGQLNMLSAAGDSIRTSENAALVDAVRHGQAGSVLNLVGAQALKDTQDIALNETRLGIPLLFCFDVVHGYRTIFPIPLGEAASFDPDLWKRTAQCAAREASADGIGLTFAPMIDVCRDPRWGRIAEGPGEDQWLASIFARAKVEGFQGEDHDLQRTDKLAATAKHIGAYGAVTAGRDYASVDISEHSLHDIYLPPFKAAVEAGVAAIMPAFVDLAGIPSSAHRALLTALVREQWHFDGVYISDYHAIAELINHGIARDLTHAAALALHAGMDIDMMSYAYINHLPQALAQGLISQDEIDQAVRRVLTLKEKLGLFDNPYRLTPHTMPNEESRALAREAAQKSIVLLKNDAHILPLSPTGGRCLIVNTREDITSDALGSWSGAGETHDVRDFETSLRAALPARDIRYITAPDQNHFDAVRKELNHAAVALIIVGEKREQSGEAASRAHPKLSEYETALIKIVREQNLPCIVMINSGRPLIIESAYDDADALLACWFLGIESGPALADVLTGRVDSTGRLPISWPRAIGQIPIFYGQKPSGRPCNAQDVFTSKYIDESNQPAFVFGHGLSYTEFSLSDLSCTRHNDRINVEVRLKNIGAREGTQTLFLFLHHASTERARPYLQLRDFTKCTLKKDEEQLISFTLDEHHFAQYDDHDDVIFESGLYDIYVGTKADFNHLLSYQIMIDRQLNILSFTPNT